jgi:hypothetical protein
MKSTKHSDELDVDFIQSRPLTEKEQKDLSAFIQKLKTKNKGKKFLKNKSRRRRLAA